MSVSIIIPTYNEEKHIEKCLYSLIEQNTNQPFELIIVDGHSTDNTLSIINTFLKKYNFISLYMNPKKNAASGRNIGISKAKYNILAFIDADAYAQANWISLLSADMQTIDPYITAGVGGPDIAPPVKSKAKRAIINSLYSPLANAGALNPSTQHSIPKSKKRVRHIPTCNLAIRKDIFDKYGLFDESINKAEDLEFSFRLNKNGIDLLFNPQNFVFHYKKDNFKSLFLQNAKWAIGKVEVMQKHGLEMIYVAPLVLCCLMLFLLFYNLQLFLMLLMVYIVSAIFESLRINLKQLNYFVITLFSLILIHLAYISGLLLGIYKAGAQTLSSFNVKQAKKKSRKQNLYTSNKNKKT